MFIKLKKTIVAPKSKILVSVLKYTRWRCNGMINGFPIPSKRSTLNYRAAEKAFYLFKTDKSIH